MQESGCLSSSPSCSSRAGGERLPPLAALSCVLRLLGCDGVRASKPKSDGCKHDMRHSKKKAGF